MGTTFDRVAGIVANTCEVERGEIGPDSHLSEDLGLDSIDMFDLTFALDKEFGVEVPVDTWREQVERGEIDADRIFIMRNFCERIDELVANKGAVT